MKAKPQLPLEGERVYVGGGGRGFPQLEWAFSVPRHIGLSCEFMGASPHLPDVTEVSLQKYSLPWRLSRAILGILVSGPSLLEREGEDPVSSLDLGHQHWVPCVRSSLFERCCL